jgi:hypothetical protein
MRMNTSIYTLILLPLIINCASSIDRLKGSSEIESHAERQVGISDESTISSRPMGVLVYQKEPNIFGPMEFELLGEIYNPDSNIINWIIYFLPLSRSEPGKSKIFTLVYSRSVRGDKFTGNITVNDQGLPRDYFYEFPSPDPFFKIVDYITANESVFFDHSEFEGLDAGIPPMPLASSDFFNFFALFAEYDPISGSYISPCIGKGTNPDGSEAPEITYVVNEINDLFDEVL